MTDRLPPNLAALFAPRPAPRYVPPIDHPPEDRRTTYITGVSGFADKLNDEFGDYKPTESWLEEKDRKKLETAEKHQKHMTEGYEEWKNRDDPNVRGDPYKTLFVSRLSYDTEVKDLENEFGRYGPIERVRIVIGNGEHEKKKKNKPKGYAFVVFERENDMKAAYKNSENLSIKGRKVVVDVERGRTVTDWRPRHFGGGLGGRHYTQQLAKPTFGSGLPSGPGFRGGFRGGYGDRGGFRGRGGGFGDRGHRGGFGGGRGGIGHQGGDRGYGGGGGRYGGAPDGAPAGPRGGYSGSYDDRASRNANFEPLPPRGGYRDRDRDRDRDSLGGYSGQKRPYDGGGYDESRQRRRY